VVLLLSFDSDLIWLSFVITCAWIAVQSSDWSPGWTTATRFGSRPAHAPSIAISASALTIVLIIDILSPSPSGGTAPPRAPQSSTGIALNGAYVRLCRAGRIDLGRQSIDPRALPSGAGRDVAALVSKDRCLLPSSKRWWRRSATLGSRYESDPDADLRVEGVQAKEAIMYTHILISTDGSEVARKGVDHGLSLAKGLGAKVTIVMVTEPWRVYTGP